MKISVIIPVYRVEAYLAQCVDSVLHQSYRDLEVILVDDGSAYAAKDPRVRVIHQQNGGASAARRAGVSNAKGDYLMFVDGDDWIDERTVEICVRKLHDSANPDCVVFAYLKETRDSSDAVSLLPGFDGNSNCVETVYRRQFGLLSDELTHPERLENLCTCWGKLYRRDVAKKGRYFDTKEVGSCEDGLFNIFALQNAETIVYVDLPLYHYRKRSGSLTASYHPEFISQWNRLFDIMEQFIAEHQLGDSFKESFQNRIALSVTAISLNELHHEDYTEWQKICCIREYLNTERYHKATAAIKTAKLPILWNILLQCSRMGWGFPVYCAARIIAAKLRSEH